MKEDEKPFFCGQADRCMRVYEAGGLFIFGWGPGKHTAAYIEDELLGYVADGLSQWMMSPSELKATERNYSGWRKGGKEEVKKREAGRGDALCTYFCAGPILCGQGLQHVGSSFVTEMSANSGVENTFSNFGMKQCHFAWTTCN